VGELVRTELAQILHSGLIKGKDASYLEDEIRSRISIVSVDVSPDLRQARVSVSIRGGKDSTRETVSDETPAVSSSDATVDKRRAYSWLVDNTKAIRHTLAQRMSHLKTSPNLSFVQVDVSAAVDIMYLIDKVSKGGFERESIGTFGGNDDNLPLGIVEDDEEDNEWEEEDDEFFSS
jgi:ribosome-binding factor A